MSCGVDRRCCSDPALLCLWRRPVAAGLIGPLAWEPPYAKGVALEKAKRHPPQKKEEDGKQTGGNEKLMACSTVCILDNDLHDCREQGWVTSGLLYLEILCF